MERERERDADTETQIHTHTHMAERVQLSTRCESRGDINRHRHSEVVKLATEPAAAAKRISSSSEEGFCLSGCLTREQLSSCASRREAHAAPACCGSPHVQHARAEPSQQPSLLAAAAPPRIWLFSISRDARKRPAT